MGYTTEQVRDELSLRGLVPAQVDFLLDLAVEHGQATFTDPATGKDTTIIGDDDEQAFYLV